MPQMNVDNVLSQIRAYSRTAETTAPANATGAHFARLLAESLDQVNSLQDNASALKTAYEIGDPGVDLPEVMIATQKASLAFEATTEIRNKLLTAYQEVMNMPV